MNYYNLKPLNINRHFIVTFYYVSLPALFSIIYRLVQSSVDQRILLTHYNLADFSIPIEVIDEMDKDYSNISMTNDPINLKRFYKAGFWSLTFSMKVQIIILIYILVSLTNHLVI